MQITDSLVLEGSAEGGMSGVSQIGGDRTLHFFEPSFVCFDNC